MLKTLFLATVAMSLFFAMLIYSVLKTQESQIDKLNSLTNRVNYWLPEVQPEAQHAKH